jgi:hypothetical protein
MQPTSTLRCANCGQQMNARVYAYIDAQKEPQAKAALVNQQLNQFQCPNCRYVNPVVAPLLYHDPSKELLVSYVPMELNFTKDQQERVIGDLMKHLPKENFKAYMFNPKRTLTMQGLIEMVLGADGITPEMINEAKQRSALVQSFVEADDATLDQLIAKHDAEIDLGFVQTFNALAQRLAQGGRPDMAQAILATQQVVVEKSSFGRELQAQRAQQELIIQDVAERLNEFGQHATREDFLKLALEYADDEMRLQALVGIARPAFDDGFFNLLTAETAKAPADQRSRYESIREAILRFVAAVDQQGQLRVGAAVELLQRLLGAEDIDGALEEHAPLIDDTFLAVLSANIQEAERRKDIQASARLKQIYERTMQFIQSKMPEEVVLVNRILQAPSDDEARKVMMDGVAQYGAVLLDVMASIAEQLMEDGREDLAARLNALSAEAASALGNS